MKFLITFLKLKLKEIGIVLVFYIPSIFLFNLVSCLYYLIRFKDKKDIFALTWFDIFIHQYFTGLGILLLIIAVIILVFVFVCILPDKIHEDLNKEQDKVSKIYCFIGMYLIYLICSIGTYFIGLLITNRLNMKRDMFDTWAIGWVGIVVLFGVGIIIYGLVYWIRRNIKKTREILNKE